MMIEEEYNRTQRLTSTISLAPVHTGIKGDDIWINVFENIDETVGNFSDIQTNIIDKLVEIENSIGRLKNESEKSVLTLHYLENLTFKEMANRMPYSERMIYYYHKKGIENLEVPEYVNEI